MALPVLPPFTTTPNRNQPATFSADTDQYHLELTPFVPLLNTWATEVNTLGEETQLAKDIAVNAKDIALSTANYKGDYVSGTYNLNESVTYTDGFNYVSKINGNTDIPTTSNWYRVPNIDDSSTTIYQMWSSNKINNELITRDDEINKKVNIDGNQTINNIKTFSDSPIVPTPVASDNSTKVASTKFVQNNKIEIATTSESQAGTDNTKAITPLRLREGLNARGATPIFAIRTFLEYDGINNTIENSGNISSVVDNGVGNYTPNFIENFADEHYANIGSTKRIDTIVSFPSKTSSSFSINIRRESNNLQYDTTVSAIITS